MQSLLSEPFVALPPNAVRVTRPEDVKIEYLAYRYPTRSPQTHAAELQQIAACVDRKFPRLTIQPRRSDVLNVVGFGPTLAHTWSHIQGPTISMSGSHDFLLERGVVPTWHAQTDGRDHQVKFLQRPHPDVTYLMASICPPAIWDALEGHRVSYWHNLHGQHVVDWIGQHDDGALLVAGGSTIGLAAIHLGGVLGFRRFRLFGLDGHSVGGARHAGVHYDPVPQKVITREANGRVWTTSPQMSNSCDELIRLLDNEDVSIEIVGESLQSDLAIEWQQSCAFWTRVFGDRFTDAWVAHVKAVQGDAESRRVQAKYNTGSIPEAAGVALKAITSWCQPRTVIELGTFIGASTLSMDAERLYTCDRSNDCLPSTERIRCHPYQGSTQMLGPLVSQGVRADLFFFDGRIDFPDVPLILRLSTPDTIYVFDDYVGAEKGVANVGRLRPFLKDYALVTPVGMVRDAMTLALLLPRRLL